jgi:hypothetical protein
LSLPHKQEQGGLPTDAATTEKDAVDGLYAATHKSNTIAKVFGKNAEMIQRYACGL